MRVIVDFYETQYGKGYLVFENNELIRHFLPGQNWRHLLDELSWGHPFVEGVSPKNFVIPRKKGVLAHKMEKYFEGTPVDFSDRINLKGTDFELKVLSACRKVKYGQTQTYKGLAQMVGSKAYRGIGQVMSKNVLPIIIPCHRIISSDGLGGWSGPAGMKEVLLNMEMRSATT